MERRTLTELHQKFEIEHAGVHSHVPFQLSRGDLKHCVMLSLNVGSGEPVLGLCGMDPDSAFVGLAVTPTPISMIGVYSWKSPAPPAKYALFPLHSKT
jgi:hypothetical protein